MKKQQFVYVSEQDIRVGGPLPWALYLRSGELLAPAGYVIADATSRDRILLAKPMRASQAGDKPSQLVTASEDVDDLPGRTVDPLQALKHNAESMIITFQFPGDFDPRSLHVDFYGRIPLQSIIVSAPAVRAANGQSWQHFEGLPMTAQVVFGRTVCAFKTSLLRFAGLPSGHLFLRYPTEAASKPFRQALRVEVKLPTSITLADGTVPGMITNLSSGGCAISTGFILGDVGTVIKLAFRFKVGGKPHLVQVNGTIRSIKGKLSQQMQYGVAFESGIDEAAELALKSFVYEHLAER
ncbi:PilZ domain-containing protein [Massilia oculi]|uniref:PilZ domain-containing protein n=1 Tax=Massilia hydrophila TaxID=3044279 RepID=A0ABS7Y4T2_9BURK|nr:PilZ domain-containing protein [Massilia oculi]MCA1854695.1 PilZ domain-containing protein [Massilia oculi]